jgi:hypothetical protein
VPPRSTRSPPAQQREHLRRVARAARVLQHERVVEIAAVAHGESQALADAHPDQAGAQRVAQGLALGEVEREGQRRQDLGNPDGLERGIGSALGHGLRLDELQVDEVEPLQLATGIANRATCCSLPREKSSRPTRGWIPLSREIFPAKQSRQFEYRRTGAQRLFSRDPAAAQAHRDDGESPRPVRAERLRVR